MSTTAELHEKYEPHPDPVALTNPSTTSTNNESITSSNDIKTPIKNVNDNVDYEPHPQNSVQISSEHQKIVNSITNLYSGCASEEDMRVYAEKSIYDDPFSYCDTRYKILGQWTGIPLLFASSKTLKTEIVKDSPSEISFKLQQEYTIKVFHGTKVVNSLVTLTLDEQGKIKYHKDQWNSKDYSHEGLGFIFKKLNGDYLPIITQPPKDL